MADGIELTKSSEILLGNTQAQADQLSDVLEKALDLDTSSSFTNLAKEMQARFELSGKLSDLDRAIALHEQALDLLDYPLDHPDRANSLNELANAIFRRFDQLGQRSDLDNAMSLYEQTLELRPAGHPKQSDSFNNLANALLTRFEESGEIPDLDRGLSLHEQALELRPPGHPKRSSSLNGLAIAYRKRFMLLGQRLDLDKSVHIQEQALELRPPGHPRRADSLNNLANAVLSRFDQSRNPADLDMAIHFHEQALALRPPNHPDHGASLTNLANCVLKRFQQSGALSDLEKAVQLQEQALALYPTHHPNPSTPLTNLATAILKSYETSGDLADLNKAILIYEQALNILPIHHRYYSNSLMNFATTLELRFERLGNIDDLEHAISRCRDGLNYSNETNPDCSTLFLILGWMFTAKFRATDLLSDLDEALDALSRGATTEFGLVKSRFRNATRWADTAIEFNRREAAVTACSVAVALLPRIFWLELDLQSRLDALKSAPGLVNDGAACALYQLKAMKAVELLEEGRGVFWAQAVQLRTPFDNLPMGISENFKDLSRALQTVIVADSSSPQSPATGGISSEEAVRRRQLNDEWLRTLKETREIPGFEHFLLPKPYSELAEAARNGPVVILSASFPLGCDAIVIRSPHASAEHVPLPGMTFEKLARLTFWLAKHTKMDLARHIGSVTIPSSMNYGFDKILQDLWTLVAKPIVDALALKKSANPSRLWWCPTSLFAFMPIHAAGIYDTPDAPNMLDFAISSYTPTLAALITARSRPLPTQLDKVLVVVQPKTPGHSSLPYTVEERTRIHRVVPPESLLKLNDANMQIQDGSDATVENVLSKLPEASIIHFACHGVQRKDPLESALVLQDGKLTLKQMMHQGLPNARIAFLSACQSAAGDQEQPDEVVHLGAAMLTAGFQSVIATMWSMGDADGPLVAEEFYTRLFSSKPDPNCTAHALHMAVRKLRSTGVKFVSWVPFIHLGM